MERSCHDFLTPFYFKVVKVIDDTRGGIPRESHSENANGVGTFFE